MKKNCSNIGGQAVLEGVMMRGPETQAMAVRDSEGKIVIESTRFERSESRKKVAKIPIIRGIVSFFESFVNGISIISRSGEVYGGDMEQEEPSKFEKWLARTFKIDIMKVVIAISAFLGIIFAVALFVIVPQVIALAIFQGAGLLHVSFDNGVWQAFQTSTKELGFGWNVLYELCRGVIRIAIFLLYIFLVSRMKDIKRLFMYHGAEHKVISCFENGLDLTVENAKTMSRQHDRCGTTFIFIVMLFSILFFTVVPVSMIDVGNGIASFFVHVAVRIALIPIIAGVSYELLKLFAKYDNVFTRVCKAPGLWLQKLTTREPDDSMLEVSIAAFKEVQELEKDPSFPVKTFTTYTTLEKAMTVMTDYLGKDRKNEAEIIAMFVCGCKDRTELGKVTRITEDKFRLCKKYAMERQVGAPLQYVLGETCFYGLDFKCDARALIPRIDTEIIVEQAIKVIKEKPGCDVLDLCTGSGCIGIAIKKNADCKVLCTDVSTDAISLAKENAAKNEADVEFKVGDLFSACRKQKFDVIVTNPPYVITEDIKRLDKEVRDYEPHLALEAGPMGMNFYEDICAECRHYLKNGGVILLEVGIGQADKVKELLGEDFEISIVKDYNTPPVDRVVIGRYLKEVKDEEEKE